MFTIFTPFDSAGELDFVSLESYIEFLAIHGAKLFYMMPYNGRFSQLTNDEISRLNAFCIACVKSDPSNTVIVSDPIHGSTATKLEFAIDAKRQGADYLSSLVREKFFSVEQVVQHYSDLSRADIDLVAHAMPFLSGYTGRSIDWPEELFAALTDVPAVKAIKEDSKDVTLARNLLATYGETFDVVVAGRKRYLIETLAGANHAYINGISMMNPDIAHEFWSLLGSSVEMALEYVKAVDDPFWEGPVAKFGWHRVNKAALESCGLMSRKERRPMPELPLSDMAVVEDAAQKVLDAHRQWTRRDSAAPQGRNQEC